jgi:hypothetical protein
VDDTQDLGRIGELHIEPWALLDGPHRHRVARRCMRSIDRRRALRRQRRPHRRAGRESNAKIAAANTSTPPYRGRARAAKDKWLRATPIPLVLIANSLKMSKL